MPGEGRIDSIIDIPAVRAEYDQLIKMLEQLGISIKNAGNGEGLKNMNDSLKAYREASKTANKATDEMVAGVKRLDQQMDKTVSAAKAFVVTNLKLKETWQSGQMSLDDLMRTQIKYALELKNVHAAQSGLTREMQNGKIAVEQYTSQALTLSKYELQLKASLKGLSSEIGLVTKAEAERAAMSAKKLEITNQQIDSNKALADSLAQVREEERIGKIRPGEIDSDYNVYADTYGQKDSLPKKERKIDYIPVDNSELTQNLQAVKSLEIELGTLQAREKQLALAFKEGQITEKVYVEQSAQLQKQIRVTKNDLANYNQQIAFQVKEMTSAEGASIKMNAQLELLKKQYRSLSAEEKKSAIGQNLQKEIKTLDTALKTEDAKLGDHQRKVGNYTGGIMKSFRSLYSNLWKISRMIPGLGIAGMFALAGGFILDIAKALLTMNPLVNTAAEKFDRLNAVAAQAATSLGKAEADVNGLKTELELAKQGVLDKTEALKHYNDTIGKTIGQTNSLTDAEKNLTDHAEAYIQFTFLKAKAEQAAALATEQTKKYVEEQQKTVVDFMKETTGVGSVGNAFANTFKFRLNPFDIDEKTIKNFQTQQKLNMDQAKRMGEGYLKLQSDYLSQAAKLAQKNGLDFYGNGEMLKGNKAIQQKFFSDLLKAQADAYKQLSQAQSLNDQTRLSARKKAFEIELGIMEKQKQIEITNENEAARASLANSTTNAHEREQIEKMHEQKLVDIQKGFNDKKAVLEMKLANDIKAIRLSVAATTQKQMDNDVKTTTDYYNQQDKLAVDLINKQFSIRKNYIEQAKAFELTGLENDKAAGKFKDTHDQYGKLLTAEQQYQEAKQAIEAKYDAYELEAQEDQVKQLIAFKKKAGHDTTDLENELAQLELKITEKKNQKKEESDKKYHAAKLELQAKEKEAAEKGYDLAVALVDGQYTAQLNSIQNQIDANTKLRDVEIKRVNDSTLSEQDKAAKIAQINAEAQRQADALDKKQRDIKLKEARFDRDAAALKILGETLFQAAKAGWITPFAIAIEAIGAAEIGTLYAKSLPHFATGTESSPEGYAKVGERGTELGITPAGQMFMTPPKETIMWLEKGTKIIPHDELNSIMMEGMIRQTAEMLSFRQPDMMGRKIDELKNIMVWQTHQINKTLKKQDRRNVIHNHIQLGWGEYIQKSVFE